SGMDRVFFTNSGAEAIEGAIKTARKYGFNKDGRTDHEIIAMNHSFHGRTMGALSVTGNPHYRDAFEPGIGNIRFADYNDLESVKKLVNDKTIAILLETVQGEGGLTPATDEFIKGIRQICDEKDILMICDEIQCGMGRTGYPFAFMKYGIKPDVITVGKALGCGVPIGAFAMTEKVGSSSLVAGDHGTTYGGNPLCCAAAAKVLEIMERDDIPGKALKAGEYLWKKLDEVAAEFTQIKEHRGRGLMQGLVFDRPVGDIINKALEKGLILINAGSDIIRFVPPLIITEADIDAMIVILKEAIAETVK
ncbi:MAG: aminotransferase class III-fold pyridoxal phosphate-dependent enzyme, partial [Lachnospiraceae bacterium]|nr:aminotransferase class III-fold pyridoxal phosphate-dependent enzyme [Lachnospiraceae bacterium]